MTAKKTTKKITVTESELSDIVKALVKKQTKIEQKVQGKLEAIENQWVTLKTAGSIQASIMPKNKDYATSSVFMRGGFKSKTGMTFPLTQAGLDSIRGTIDLIEKQCF
ncbi:MAG: hypothetical protein HOG33_04490 [Candidatus Marinimicrobia bacterium]|nr:hypothetical protein [Candidatus Neomarinimicrobiota bacterium]